MSDIQRSEAARLGDPYEDDICDSCRFRDADELRKYLAQVKSKYKLSDDGTRLIFPNRKTSVELRWDAP